MSKREMLEVVKLLSALESWSFSAAKPMPDYLFDRMDNLIVELSEQLLNSCDGAENVRD
jgi:hypothetical protein